MGLKPRWESVAGWKRKLLYLAAGVGLFGLVTDNYGAFSTDAGAEPPPAAEASGRSPSMATGYAEGAVREDTRAIARPEPVKRQWTPEFTWGAATTRLGLSFAAGFVAALVIRWFIRTALTIAALVAGAVAILVHYGVIEPFWGEDFELVRDIGHWLEVQTRSLAVLIKSYLPSGAASAAGIFLGLRK